MPIEVDPTQVHSIEVDPSQVQAAPAQPQGSALQRFASGLYQSTVAPVVQAVQHPIDTAAGMISNAIGIDDLHQAFDEYRKGNYGNAALMLGKNLAEGPAGRAAKATIQPIVQDADQGNYAGAAGRALGTAATLAVPEKGIPGVADATSRIAQFLNVPENLREAAETQYGRVLAPSGTGDKIRTANVVPQLIDEGVIARSRKALAAKAANEVQAASENLEQTYNALPPDATIPLKPVLDRMEQAKQGMSAITPGGKTQPLSSVYAVAIKHIDDLGDVLTKFAEPGPEGELAIPVSTARVLKQAYDEVAAKAGRYNGVDLATQSQGAAHGIAADAIREGIAENFPDVDAANRQFKMWRDTQQVIDNTNLRKQGQSPSLSQQIISGAATAGGFASGGLHGAILGKATVGALQDAISSTAWRTVSSVLKDRLADALENRDIGASQFYASKIVQQLSAAGAAGKELPAGSSPAQ